LNGHLVEAKQICKSFGSVKALDCVDFCVNAGEAICLVGENGSGKSTLIKIISGAYAPDSGEIILSGKKYARLSPRRSIAEGIQVIYQDFSLFGNLSVAENITMSYRLYHKERLINERRNRRMAIAKLADLGIEIEPDEEVSRLSVGEKQSIAICRALMLDAKLVIMDEPTTALTTKEIEYLYKIIENLKKRGISLIFVSHKLDEVFKVAEKVCILRDGKNVVFGPKEDFNRDSITYHMTGRKIESKHFTSDKISEKPILEVKALSHKKYFKDISFDLRRGEILGITGLLGSGRTELAETIFGLRRKSSGEICVNGNPLRIRESYDAVKNGIGYLPEDRLTQGLFLDLAIDRNISSAIIRKYSAGPLKITDKKGIQKEVAKQIEQLSIKLGSKSDPATSLSGGNQQRIVLAKWLATEPQVLILNCPTVGVDVGSKSDIHDKIMELAKSGMGIILISDDLPEILQVCSRIVVISKGQIVTRYPNADVDEATLQGVLAGSQSEE
jgi:simple sugar transport system ATP-binding protein